MVRRGAAKLLAMSVCAVVLVSGCSQAQCARDRHHTLENSLEMLDAQRAERYPREGGECARVSVEGAEVELCEFESQHERDDYIAGEDDSNLAEPLSPLMSLVASDKRARDSTLEALTPGQTACS